MELNPQIFHPYLDLGKALLEKKDFKKALNYLQIALKLAPYIPEIHFLIGENLLGLGELEQAIIYYQKTIDLDFRFVQNYDKIESTIMALKEVAQVNPNHQEIANLIKAITNI
ncbi:MAG: tetratricopeptide repeat protein [Trichodesmium sp. ALOHA_ZT_67]|nr:tetratricopeptide repeat protein [Trichodesmium sp. ALOHA_ZT_67]